MLSRQRQPTMTDDTHCGDSNDRRCRSRIVARPLDAIGDRLLGLQDDWAQDRCRAILQKCWAALPGGGQVIIAELLVNDARTGPPPAALMSLNMLVETEGRNYTPAEYGAWLSDLGFQDIRTVWFEAAGANGAVIGRKQ